MKQRFSVHANSSPRRIVAMSAAVTLAFAMLAPRAVAATSTPDENGVVPYMWWDCKGLFTGEHSKGSSDSNDVINKRIIGSNGIWDAFTRYRDDPHGAVFMNRNTIGATEYPWFRISDAIKYDRDWSIVFTARGCQRVAPMLALGHTNNPTNFVLAVNSSGGATLYLQERNNTPQPLASTTGVDAGYRFHTYIITYVQATGTMVLWADGVKQGEYAGLSSHGGNTEVNFGRDMSTGNQLGKNVYDVNDLGMAVADFRVYQNKTLSEAEIATIASANPVWPATAISVLPRVYFNCDGVFDKGYYGDGGINDFYKLPGTWCESAGGVSNAYCFAGTRAGFRAGSSNLGNASASWTVVFSGRVGAENDNVALIGLGHQNNPNSIVVASAGEGKIKVSQTGEGTPSKTAHTDLITDIAVANAASSFHSYALVNDHANSTLSLYVDGALAGSCNTYSSAVAGNEFNLGQSNSTGSGGFLTAYGTAIDDFRIYNEVFTADQVASYAAEFPVTAMASSDVKVSSGGAIELTLSSVAAQGVLDSLSFDGEATIAVTLSGTVNTSDPYTVVSSDSELDLDGVTLTLVTSGYEYGFSPSSDGTKLMLSVLPNPTAKVTFNGTTQMDIGSSSDKWWGDNADEAEVTAGAYIASGDGANGAVKVSSTVVPFYKGGYGQEKQSGDNGWTLALNIRSVEEAKRLLFGAGYRNNSTPYTWGLVADGKDSIKFVQWTHGDNWTVVSENVIPVPEATVRFHEIVIVHPANSVNTDNSIIAYVDGVEAARGNFYTHVLGDGANNGTGNNIAVGGMAKWVGWGDENYGNGYKRGDGVAASDLRFYSTALTAEQISVLGGQSGGLAAWPEMTTVAVGETLTIGEPESWTDKLLKFEAGATLAMPVTGSLTLQKSLYDLGSLLVLPASGTVTVALSGVEGMEPGGYTVIDDAAAISDISKFALAPLVQGGNYHVRLQLVDGNLACRLSKSGLCVIIR